MTSFSDQSNDELADGICTWAGRLAAGTARLLDLVAEFDRREGWAGPGMLSCSHWLSWRISLAPGTAREWVRVARRLEELPAIHAAFGSGQMSWSQVRAVTRVATVHDGIDWVDLARHSSARQLERVARGIRRAQRVEEVAADPEEAAYQLRTRQRYDADGNLTITIYAPAQYAPLILAGIEAQRAELDRQRQAEAGTDSVEDAAAADAEPEDAMPEPADVPAGTRGGDEPAQQAAHVPAVQGSHGWTAEQVAAATASSPWVQTVVADGDTEEQAAVRTDRALGRPTPDADRPIDVPAGTSTQVTQAAADLAAPAKATDGEALLAMARAALDAQHAQHPEIARRTRSELVAQVDPLSGWARLRDGELLHLSSLAAVLKTLPGRGGVVRLRPLTAADLTSADLGRTARQPSLALRELLGTVDGERCRFPGCMRHRKLHAHHVLYWSQGGCTDLSNLVLLCSRHHTLVHQLGFQLTLKLDRRLDVRTAGGAPVLHHPVKPWGDPSALDPTGQVSAGTLPSSHCDAKMDLGYVVSVLLQQTA